ncbi:hypothetical protein PANO111632_18865 [Paracoccus nototheniae]
MEKPRRAGRRGRSGTRVRGQIEMIGAAARRRQILLQRSGSAIGQTSALFSRTATCFACVPISYAINPSGKSRSRNRTNSSGAISERDWRVRGSRTSVLAIAPFPSSKPTVETLMCDCFRRSSRRRPIKGAVSNVSRTSSSRTSVKSRCSAGSPATLLSRQTFFSRPLIKARRRLAFGKIAFWVMVRSGKALTGTLSTRQALAKVDARRPSRSLARLRAPSEVVHPRGYDYPVFRRTRDGWKAREARGYGAEAATS